MQIPYIRATQYAFCGVWDGCLVACNQDHRLRITHMFRVLTLRLMHQMMDYSPTVSSSSKWRRDCIYIRAVGTLDRDKWRKGECTFELYLIFIPRKSAHYTTIKRRRRKTCEFIANSLVYTKTARNVRESAVRKNDLW